MTSILESSYLEPTRPYSQKELNISREKMYKYLKLSQNRTHHTKCGHFYKVKINSRKEAKMKETNNADDVGNCSVCWRLKNTERYLYDNALNVISIFSNKFRTEPTYLTYDMLDVETVFYKWLNENNSTNY